MKPGAAIAGIALLLAASLARAVTSPDGHLRVTVAVSAQQGLRYAVQRDGAAVVDGALGLELAGADLASALRLGRASAVKPVRDSYVMAVGKRSRIAYAANEQHFTAHNASGQAMDIVFRVSNDGVAFRYVIAEPGLPHKRFIRETSSFHFGDNTQAWLQPIAVAQTGWANTNPSYEEHYQRAIAVGTPSPSPAGWVFPALFKSDATWIALTEANMDGSWHASRLQAASPGGEYRIGAPMDAEVATGGALLAETDGVMTSPWRVMAIGSLATLMQSTLGTDLAAPAIPFDPALVKPGHAAWSWALLKDDATIYSMQQRFIDYAADMHWDYALVDADWDRKIGYDGIGKLVAYGAARQVGILVWYNSSGAWNQTTYSPKGALLTRAQRRVEFARLRALGVKGIKVDFFAGDGKSMIAYYLDILRDAADHGLLVNFHGATLPRGWERTWPNLMTMEAVRGLEFTTFTQADQDAVARHAATLPFARNLFDPMDFTPMVFGDIPKIKRSTRNGFELAESVLFLSGIQHFAETPDGMAAAPDYVRQFLRELPHSWDDVRFIDGYPGKLVVLARRAGDTWYVAGINADDSAVTITPDLGFLGLRKGVLINDGATERSFVQGAVAGATPTITLQAHGGFVAVFK